TNRQGYVRHTAGLDHRSSYLNHRVADTHGDKSAKPGHPQRTLIFFTHSSRPYCAYALRYHMRWILGPDALCRPLEREETIP
ncbi:MAG: hypothetical protein ABSE42_19030, partial [Bryobacteraceae bacterium]